MFPDTAHCGTRCVCGDPVRHTMQAAACAAQAAAFFVLASLGTGVPGAKVASVGTGLAFYSPLFVGQNSLSVEALTTHRAVPRGAADRLFRSEPVTEDTDFSDRAVLGGRQNVLYDPSPHRDQCGAWHPVPTEAKLARGTPVPGEDRAC